MCTSDNTIFLGCIRTICECIENICKLRSKNHTKIDNYNIWKVQNAKVVFSVTPGERGVNN